MPYDKTLDGANSSVLHTRFKLCKKLISQKNPEGTSAIQVKGRHCIGVLYMLTQLYE